MIRFVCSQVAKQRKQRADRKENKKIDEFHDFTKGYVPATGNFEIANER